MCGRYSLFVPPDELEERFEATYVDEYTPRYNAAPGESLPVVTDDEPGAIRHLRWGLVPPWADDPAGGHINARAETLAEKPSFREAYGRRRPHEQGGGEPDTPQAGRCLVLADGFYEWVETGQGKRPYRVTRADGEPFAMAGLWTRWEPETAQAGLDEFGDGTPAADPEAVETFAVVTTEPNDVVADLHDRMAAILPPDRERRWLSEPAGDLLAPYEGDLRAYPVSTAVNDPANDSPEVVREVDP